MTTGRVDIMVVVLLSASIVAGGGIAQRWLSGVLAVADSVPVPLEQPLSSLPIQIGSWRGVDIPVDERVLQVAANDDYVCRRYSEDGTKNTVDFYVAYTARPANMLGHRPDVCYPAHGWTLLGTRKDRLSLTDGTKMDCLIHRFNRHGSVNETRVVLNYYILGGRHTTEWTDFWSPWWRSRNLARDPHFYVAQVQFSSTVVNSALQESTEQTIKRFAAEIAGGVDELLPLTRAQEPNR